MTHLESRRHARDDAPIRRLAAPRLGRRRGCRAASRRLRTHRELIRLLHSALPGYGAPECVDHPAITTVVRLACSRASTSLTWNPVPFSEVHPHRITPLSGALLPFGYTVGHSHDVCCGDDRPARPTAAAAGSARSPSRLPPGCTESPGLASSGFDADCRVSQCATHRRPRRRLGRTDRAGRRPRTSAAV